MHPAARLHDRHALDRLEGTQQHAGADPGTLARNVDAKVHPIYQVNVRVTAAQEQRAVTIRLASVGMATRVAGNVGLGFDDAAAGAPLGGIAYERLSDEKIRERGGVDRKIGTLQSFHGINSTFALGPGHLVARIAQHRHDRRGAGLLLSDGSCHGFPSWRKMRPTGATSRYL